MKNSKKLLLMFTVIFTLSSSFFVYYNSMESRLDSESFQSIQEKKSMQTMPLIEPKSSTITMNITKTADILDGVSCDVFVSGMNAYIADAYNGLKIINISDPTTPVEIGNFDDGGDAYRVYVSGSYAYVAESDDGLEIIDISDPTTPVEVGQFNDGGEARGVYKSGSYAFVADYDDGLEIIDISDPTTPVEVGQYDDGGRSVDVFVSGSYAYVADADDGLEIIDISDPTTPVEVGQFNDGGGYTCSVYVSGSYAYVADGSDGLEIIDISDPTTPVEVGQFSDGGYASNIYVSGSYAYEMDNSYGLDIIDISDPTTPVEVGQFDDGGEARGVYVSGSYAYMADGSDGLEIIDISDPTTPVEVGQLDQGAWPETRAVYVLGSYAYVADGNDGLDIIDISDPTAPVEIGQFYDGSGYAKDVFVSGSYAYVADGIDGLEIIDITDPSTPVEVGQFNDGGDAGGIYVSGSYAYVADGIDGLETIDISDPTTPVEVGQYYDSTGARDVFVSGVYTYVLDGEGLTILGPSGGILRNGGSPNSVYVLGSYAYVTYGSRGLDIIDISDPSTPTKVGQFDDGGLTAGVYVSGSYAYIADGPDGLEIIDISNPTTPVEVGQFCDGGDAYNVYVSGSYAYMADRSDGLEILHVTEVENTINITTPDGSSSWETDSSHYVYWDSTGYISTVDIELFKDGIFESVIASDVSNEGSYNWTIPSGLDNSTNYQINITDSSDSSVHNYTEFFEIYTNLITITAPNSSSIWETDSSNYIYWDSTGYISAVNIELFKDGIYEIIIASGVSNDGSYYWMLPSGLDDSMSYQIKITDASDSSMNDYSDNFEIYTNVITVTTPDSLSSWDIDSSHYIYWGSTGYISTVNIELFKGGIFNSTIASALSNDGSYYWTVPSDLAEATDYQIKITDFSDSSVYDYSYNFEINANFITITAPDNLSSWDIDTSRYIYWGSTGDISMVNIELFKDGLFESTIVSNVLNDGSYYWTISSGLGDSTNYQIKIIDSSDSSVYDFSNFFEINANFITLTTPDSLSSWKTDSSHNIYWDSIGDISTVNIDLYKDGIYESTIASAVSNDGSYDWILPSGLEDSMNYQIKITDSSDSSVNDFSDNFEIYTNLITVTSPDSSSSWDIDSSQYIYWYSAGYISTVNIELFKDGIYEAIIASGVLNDGSYDWTLSSGLDDSMNYQIKIIDSSDSSVYNISNFFEINANFITLTTPDSLSSWKTDSSHNIYWDSIGDISMVNLELYKDEIFEISIASDVSNDGSYSWTVPSGLDDSTNYQIKITDSSDPSVYDYSDNFEICTILITITAPNSIFSWETESSQNIYWNSIGDISMVNIELFKDGIFEVSISSDVSNDGSYYWILPSDLSNSTNYQIKIIDASDDSVYDMSDYFEILNISDNPDDPNIPDDSSITGYNPLLLLSAMVGISVILALKKLKSI